MARLAEIFVCSAAHEHGDTAAVLALEVNELIAVLLTHLLSEAEVSALTLAAKEIFPLSVLFGAHGICTVLKSTKVDIGALRALIEGALVKGILPQFAEVIAAFSHHWTTFIQSFFPCLGKGEVFNVDFLLDAFRMELGELRHVVVKDDLLLAAGAVKEAESDFQGAISMSEHLS